MILANRFRALRSLFRFLLVLTPLALLTGCGYSSGIRLPDGAQSVGVTVFGNAGPFPELERELFSVLSSQASRMVDGEVREPKRADLLVRGEIIDYRRLMGVLNPDGELLQSGVHIVLRAWIEDRRIAAQIGESIYFDQSAHYIIHTRAEEEGARRDALAQMCQELIIDLFSQPSYEVEGSPEPTDPDVELLPLEPLEALTEDDPDA
ncbi:MAG: hypothetical protein ACI8X5_001409 [Planctomycetota bacterium]|jgi:hypothetical protein